MPIALGRCLAVLMVLLCAGVTSGEPTLDPYTVKSASGRFVLTVDPSSMDGAGKARYSLSESGKPAWSDEQPFTLWSAAVADDGTVCGFAYNNGHDGRRRGEGDPELLCIVIDPAGKVRVQDAHPRQHPNVLSNPPAPFEPLALGITLDQANDRFIVRAIGGSFDTEKIWWWTYRISTGESLGEVVPELPERAANGMSFCREISAELLPGTPLLLVHWYIYKTAVRFALLDPLGKEIWKLDNPDEYANLGDAFSWWSLSENGISQAAVRPGGFDVVSYAMNARVTFSVTADPAGVSGFAVKETGRVEEKPKPKDDRKEPQELAQMALEPAGTIELRAPRPTSPIDNVHEFNIDAKGRLGFVRWTNTPGQPRFVVVASDGAIVADLPLELGNDPKGRFPVAAPVEGDRWVILRSWYETTDGTQAWWVDLPTGRMTPVEGFAFGEVEAVRAVPGGGFAVQGGYRSRQTVVVFDAKGTRVATVEGGGAKSVAVLTDGSIAALSTAEIEWFDPKGQPTGTDKIEDLIGYAPNYPSSIRADRDGGLILEDFRGVKPIYRFGADKKQVGAFAPRHKDGSEFRPMGGVQRAPDGTLWTADGHALLRLTEDGVVDRVLGPSPATDELSGVNALVVGPNGLIYVTDARTFAVHVFDITGARLRVHQRAPGDFSNDKPADDLAITADGSIWAHARHTNLYGVGKYLGIAPDGTRLDPKPCTLDRVTETWMFQPRSKRRWVLGYESVWLVDDDDEVVQTITHRPSGAWLGKVGEGAVAPDGSLALIVSPSGWGMRGPVELDIYSAAGDSVKSIPLPDKWMGMRVAFNGRWAITSNETELHLFNVQTGAAGRVLLPAEAGTKHYWYVHTSPDGSEAWVQDSQGLTLLRFKLPV